MSEEKEDGWLIGWIGKIFELPDQVLVIRTGVVFSFFSTLFNPDILASIKINNL